MNALTDESDKMLEAGDVKHGRQFRRFGCLKCHQTLYMVGQLETDVWARTSDSPRIERKNGGFYMTCPHCGAAHEFEHAPTRVGIGLRLKRLVE